MDLYLKSNRYLTCVVLIEKYETLYFDSYFNGYVINLLNFITVPSDTPLSYSIWENRDFYNHQVLCHIIIIVWLYNSDVK